MHGSAETLVESGGTSEDLSHCSVEEEAYAELLGGAGESLACHGYGSSAPELVHNLLEFLLRKDFDGAHTLGEDFAVGTMGTEDEVVGVEGVCHTDSGSLLAHGKVGRSRVVVCNSVVSAGGLHEVEHGLELADGEHIPIDIEKVLLGEMAFLKLFLDGFVVRHHRNLRELDFVFLRTEDLIRVDEK